MQHDLEVTTYEYCNKRERVVPVTQRPNPLRRFKILQAHYQKLQALQEQFDLIGELPEIEKEAADIYVAIGVANEKLYELLLNSTRGINKYL